MTRPSIATNAPSMPDSLAVISSPATSEIALCAALALTVGGVVLQLNQSRHRMGLEERLKDGKVSGDEVRRQILFYSRLAPVVTLLGIVALALILFDLVG